MILKTKLFGHTYEFKSLKEVMAKANGIKEELARAGIRVKLDDADKSPGWKFAEAEICLDLDCTSF